MPSAQEPSSGGPTLREGWLLIAVSFFGVWAAYMTAFMLGPMLDALSHDLEGSVSAMGQLAAITFFPWALSAPLIGPFSDRYGRKTILLTGLAGLALSNLAASFAPDYLTLAACRFLTGVFGGFVPPSCVATLSDHFSGPRRGNALAIATSGISATVLVGLPAVAYITDRLGWRGSFVAVALFTAAVLLLSALVFPRTRRSGAPLGYLGNFGWMRQPSPWRVMGGNILERMMLSLFLTYVSVFFIRRYGVSLSALAGLLTTMSAGALIGGLAGGPLAGRRRRYAALVAVMLIDGALLTWAFGFAPPLALAVGAGFLFSLMSALGRPTLVDSLATLAPRSRGTIIGFYATSNQLGQLMGASLGGLALAWGGFEAMGGLALAAGIAGALFYRPLIRAGRPG